MKSWTVGSAGWHVTAHRYYQAHRCDSEAAHDKRQPPRRVGKQHQSGEREKKSGWHHQQSGVLHVLPLP